MRVHAALLLATVLAGCGGPARSTLASVERRTGGAREADPLPLVVVLPGRGGAPRSFFAQAFHGFTTPARVVVLEAPIAEGHGFAWFTFGPFADTDGTIRALMPRLDATFRALVATYPTRGRPVVTGFSQGAMLIYPYLARHPSRFGAAVPVAGAAWPDLLPAHFDGALLPPIHALHGDADEVIPASAERDTLAEMRAHGAHGDLQIVPGAHHWIGGALRTRFQATLAAALAP